MFSKQHHNCVHLCTQHTTTKTTTRQFDDVQMEVCTTKEMPEHFNRSDGRVVRASASGAVDSSLISSQVKPMTLKLVFTASLLDIQHQRDIKENKPASLPVMLLGKALNRVPLSWCDRQVAGNF